jgi:hypothetical protein
MTAPRPKRVVITGPRRDVHRAPRRSAADDIDQQTVLGAVYLHSLMRSQLLLGVAAVAMVVVPLASMPLLFALWPSLRDLQVGPLPLWWFVLGLLVYPAMLAVAWWYIRRADRNEQQFAELVEGR